MTVVIEIDNKTTEFRIDNITKKGGPDTITYRTRYMMLLNHFKERNIEWREVYKTIMVDGTRYCTSRLKEVILSMFRALGKEYSVIPEAHNRTLADLVLQDSNILTRETEILIEMDRIYLTLEQEGKKLFKVITFDKGNSKEETDHNYAMAVKSEYASMENTFAENFVWEYIYSSKVIILLSGGDEYSNKTSVLMNAIENASFKKMVSISDVFEYPLSYIANINLSEIDTGNFIKIKDGKLS